VDQWLDAAGGFARGETANATVEGGALMRSKNIVAAIHTGKQTELQFGQHNWLMWRGENPESYVCAVRAEEVFFPDCARSAAEMRAINEFFPQLPHVRVPEQDFDYYVASSAMRGLRPLLGRSLEHNQEKTDG
jgi:hypothetical protein